ncbi:hypothetical protein JN11_02619 [Mucilaginibacter frigoritolerans]|uniref:Uncharacterized protein n=1 Tax=Mucilaginibacter frigoritolerans TaxID=652788 RepID=A0A562U0C4_9SPHI|nr:hypothetical protein [Mucilaginibacter frigoritolerans]TWI99302.1 hypothetical protein JN11_02619 [Mucilaginibacter frigoritolerans]
MDMQDKELDELFSSKLDNFEVQPSAQVWDNISAGLTDKKRKKSLIPFLSVAASITVLVTAYVLFIPQKQNTGTHPGKNTFAGTKTNIKNTPANILQADTNKPAITSTSAVYAKVNTKYNSHPSKTIRVVHLNEDYTVDTVKTINTTDKPIYAEVSQRQTDAIKAIVPDENIPLQSAETPALDTKHALAMQVLPVNNKQETRSVKKKHRMNTFGDMMNAVIAKIDKRQNKFIEFSNTDGDEATITSVNLGIVKIKKEEKVDQVN